MKHLMLKVMSVIVIVAFSLTTTLSLPISATVFAETMARKPLFDHTNTFSDNCAFEQAEELGGKVAERFKKLALNSKQFREFRKELKRHYEKELPLETNEISVLSHCDSIVASIPIQIGKDFAFHSIWFEKTSKQSFMTVSALFAFGADNNIVAEVNINGKKRADAALTSDGQFVKIILYNAEGQEISLDEASLEKFRIKYFSDIALPDLVCEDLAQFITMIILLFLCFPICQIDPILCENCLFGNLAAILYEIIFEILCTFYTF